MRKPDEYREAADELEADAAAGHVSNREEYLSLARSYRRMADVLEEAEDSRRQGPQAPDDEDADEGRAASRRQD
jgi:hypothetical protein